MIRLGFSFCSNLRRLSCVTRLVMAGYITLLTGFFAMAGHAATPVIIVQSATSIQNSGLYDHLLPLFKTESDIDVRIVAVGTGQALRNAKKCDAELVIVHSKIDEEKFVTERGGSSKGGARLTPLGEDLIRRYRAHVALVDDQSADILSWMRSVQIDRNDD